MLVVVDRTIGIWEMICVCACTVQMQMQIELECLDISGVVVDVIGRRGYTIPILHIY